MLVVAICIRSPLFLRLPVRHHHGRRRHHPHLPIAAVTEDISETPSTTRSDESVINSGSDSIKQQMFQLVSTHRASEARLHMLRLQLASQCPNHNYGTRRPKRPMPVSARCHAKEAQELRG